MTTFRDDTVGFPGQISMRRAFYVTLMSELRDGCDHFGGSPTHQPPHIPRCRDSGKPMGFLFEVLQHPDRLPLAGVAAIQIYQSSEVDQGGDFRPALVVVPAGAKRFEGGVVPNRSVAPHTIVWDAVDEPDEIPLGPDGINMYGSKVGGAADPSLGETGDQILGQFGEDLPGINFGRRTLILLKRSDGQVHHRLL